jgi:hypothetical protein
LTLLHHDTIVSHDNTLKSYIFYNGQP